ncbi:MAG: uroporphyrinogen-III C-methyltransferase [Fibrobacteria bacterium]|nr:uroporphyrinogen-III C-methyltransferase [Fibrobacteria bacterium]
MVAKSSKKTGVVYLVGAGPGDPELLTVKGQRLIKEADVILFDKLANDEILMLAKKKTEKLYVGKKAGFHIVPQSEINRKLVELAKAGKKVVRLKGGDPFVLGRGGEECEYLKKHDVPFEIIPGISSILGVTAYAGIPLTHRDYADNFAVATGHQSVINETKKLSVPKADTLVYLMGVTNLPNILEALQAAGYKDTMPIALIERGTTKHQKVATGTIKNIQSKVKKEGIEPPALIIVGNVVKLRKKINWFI